MDGTGEIRPVNYITSVSVPSRELTFDLAVHDDIFNSFNCCRLDHQYNLLEGMFKNPGTCARYAPLSSSPPAYTPGFALGGSPGSPFGAGGLDGTHTLMSAHRRESFDGAGVGTMEPISPSSVPGLGFDEDAFEDDRESEGSSLPSAASEVQRRDVDWYHAPLAQAPQHHLEQHQSQVQGSPESEREQPEGSLVTPPGEGVGEQRGPAKKRKMHQCTVCFKMFPRPSGLAMHMNSHAGAKLPGPDVHKAVCGPVERKAAPAHARNFPLGGARLKTFLVHEVKRLPPKLRWVLSALSTRTNAGALPRTVSPHHSLRTPPLLFSTHSY
ncbi:uncharacterized protein BXZ73DRAFT_106510 [Epithele typhae]|uniref:uncharacterized protein n=1 Tax=Epithele typhae TaxID=378194 RepID=UPI00200756B5|nr:uncharacterized protein BXZ73DRAFT_106510 [Epithele typhae]KAH9914678.1 hypothetical protein BXZ73DRAFT_106510 [Epithele typhae]